ncbi:MAG: hypothetical protein H0X42_06180 [Solirubrobacterales bacterium]|nr:hypothetical protein [Solirubrobacterales bacterium]
MVTAELLLLLAKHLLLTGLPLAAAMLFAARKGVRQVPVLLAIGLAASGILGLLGFWTYYGNRPTGESFSYLVLLGSVAVAGWSLYGGHLERALLRRLATPLALWSLGTGFLVFLGFAHGGANVPLLTPMSRFSQLLPGDNYLPLYFAEYFLAHGHHGTPPDYASFLASDRPPLQIGYALSQHPFGWDKSQLDYQLMGVGLQQLWIVGLWALLLAARVGRTTRALAMGMVLVSDLAIVNGFFVWPKLLPAAMLLAAAALVLTPLWQELRTSLWAAALFAALCGLAMMGHGSSVFGVIPLLAIAAWRGLPGRRWLGVAVAVGIVILAPWSAYQKYGDPPGNRLTKWSLSGFTGIDGRSTGEAIREEYARAGLGGAIHNHVENFVTMSGGTMAPEAIEAALDTGKVAEVIRTLRVVVFFYLLPSLGLLLLGPIAMILGFRRGRRNQPDWRLAVSCYLAFLIGAVAWGLLLFGNGEDRTIVHVGSYLLPMLGLVGGVVGLRAVLPRFAVYWVGLSALFSLVIYAPALDPLPGTAYSASAIFLCAAALACFGFVLWRDGEPREEGVMPTALRPAPELSRV